LEPFDSEPWIKGLTAGTDDHGGIFIGRTYTELDAWDSDQLLAALKEKRSFPGGSHSDYQSLAFSVYKVLHDCSKQKEDYRANSLLNQLTETLLESKPMGMLNKMRIKRLGMRARKRENEICRSFYELAHTIQKQEFPSIGEAIQFVDTRLAHIADEFLRAFFCSLEESLKSIDLPKLAHNVTAFLPGIFLSLPFMFALRHLNENRSLVEKLKSNLQLDNTNERSRILWFTDTINDLNGVSYTLNEIGHLAHLKGLNLKIVTSLDDAGPGEKVPPYILNLPCIHGFSLPFYERYSLKVPSMLRSLKDIYCYDPDMIYISTPGPVGLVGLLGARLMNVKSVGFYHTDFTLQTSKIVDDLSVANILEAYTKWFYRATDEIRVPTKEYIKTLARRGFEPNKLHLFKRGIDAKMFLPRLAGRAFLKERWGLNGDKTLLYVGRISKDKSLDFLLETFSRLSQARPSAKLLLVGDGPHLQELKKRANGTRSILFAGRIEQEELSLIYSGADLFVFPSTTDTFGKAVLEAQACGCPAVVSDEGGPQELIVDGKTGFVAEAGNLIDWTRKIERALSMMDHSPIAYQKMKEEARTHAVKNHSWEEALDELLTHAVLPDPLWEKMIA
jgi:glycosyltransferase involved in cell wall biosynthesis